MNQGSAVLGISDPLQQAQELVGGREAAGSRPGWRFRSLAAHRPDLRPGRREACVEDVGLLCFSKCPAPQWVEFQASIFLLTQPCDQTWRQRHPDSVGAGFCEKASQSPRDLV